MSNVNKNVHLFNMNRLAMDLPRLTGAADATVAASLKVNGVIKATVTITVNDANDKQQVASFPVNFKLVKNDKLEIDYVETGSNVVVITLTCRVIIGTLNG